MTSTYLPSLC